MMFSAKNIIRLLIVLIIFGSFSFPAFAAHEISESIKAEVEPKELQTALSEAGFYKGSIDGVLGPKTKEAIRKFQEANDLKADGVCGPKTWEKLKAYSEEAAGIDAQAATATTEAETTTSTSSTATTTEEEVATAPALDESTDEDYYSYSEFDSTGSDADNSELKQKLVS